MKEYTDFSIVPGMSAWIDMPKEYKEAYSRQKAPVKEPIKFSVIIPYMHTKERYPLLMACLSSIKSDVEICLVEIGKERNIFIPNDIKYMFIKYDGVMHRAWALNIGAKHLSTGNRLILLDADVIIPSNFFEIMKRINFPAVAWNRMYYLNQKNTQKFLNLFENPKTYKKFLNKNKCDVIKKPQMHGAAGGVTIIPRDIFFEYKGVPENFEGTWGGPDNTLMAKYRAFGYNFKAVKCECIHLWHPKNTPRNGEIASKARSMIRWKKVQWLAEFKKIGDLWGESKKSDMNIDIPRYMAIKTLNKNVENNMDVKSFTNKEVINDLCMAWSGFNKNTLERVFENKETILSVAMLSLYRTDILLKMLNYWKQTIRIPANMSLNVQGSEQLKVKNKDLIKEKVNDYFDKSYITFTKGNRGTGVPRHSMVHQALEFNTPYIMTTDDDMFFPPGSIEALISILEDRPDIGAVDIWVYPNLNAWYERSDRMIYRQPEIPFGFVDGMGSATMIVRREVFETCDYDSSYYIGWADIDFCMQMKKNNWKTAILALPSYKALNYKKKNPTKYKNVRYNAKHASDSSVRFRNKWKKHI